VNFILTIPSRIPIRRRWHPHRPSLPALGHGARQHPLFGAASCRRSIRLAGIGENAAGL